LWVGEQKKYVMANEIAGFDDWNILFIKKKSKLMNYLELTNN
jgi:hypothetical protein